MSFYLSKRPEGSPVLPPQPDPGGITHGEQLTINDVGPWKLQNVAKGAESLDVVPVPGRGFWILDTPAEYAPTGAYVANNLASNKGGIVPAGGVTIDGFALPAGTVVCQFRDLSGADFSAHVGGTYLFRGCRFRQNGVGDPSQFNDFNATYTNYLHYCDMGGLSAADVDADAPFWKSIGGVGHRVLRCYMTYEKVALQPNVHDFQILENYIDKITWFWGAAGPPGGGGPNHTAAIGCEGGIHGLRIMRNRIVIPSPDDAARVIENGATVAMEGTGSDVPYSDCQIVDNYVAGANYAFLLFGEDPGQTNLVVTGNKVTTQWWTNGGISGPLQAGPFPVPWGSNGNVKSNNTWADDYGTGGTGSGTPLSSRQFPAGNGPRKGTIAF